MLGLERKSETVRQIAGLSAFSFQPLLFSWRSLQELSGKNTNCLQLTYGDRSFDEGCWRNFVKKINLDSMSEAELRELNREIVRRLEIFSLTRRKMQLMAFHVGDRVEFDDGYQIISGIITRVNQKTATIQTDDGRGWRVAPSLLRRVNNSRDVSEVQANLFQLPTNAGKNS